MNISAKEFKILRKLYKRKLKLDESPEIRALLDKGFITAEITGMEDCVIQYSDYYEITNAGIVAYEEYRYSHATVRGASVRSWIAIIISVIALLISALNTYMSHFKP